MKSSRKKALQNRIVGSGAEDPKLLLANPENWRTHPKSQEKALESVLETVGWVQQVIVNRTTGHLVDGHLRVELAIKRDEPTIPVIYVELSAKEERLMLATLDPISAFAESDDDTLRKLVSGCDGFGDDIDDLLSRISATAEDIEVEAESESAEGPDAIGVLVTVLDSDAQEELLLRLREDGYKCRFWTGKWKA